MPLEPLDRSTVEALYRAMHAGPSAESDLLALFADDAVLVEPFAGQPREHHGKDAIRASFAPMWQNRAPDLALTLDRVDLDGGSIRADWTCTSAAMPGPMRGRDLIEVRSGRILRLEIHITEMPGFAP